jgi:TolB protein
MYAYSVDATLKILKRNFYIPKVYIEDYTQKDVSRRIKIKIKKLLKGDFIVSGHMQAIENKKLTSLSKHPDYTLIKRNKIDLVLKYRAFIDKNDKLRIKVNIFDINNNDIAYSKTYITSRKQRYPFLVHNLTIDLNNHLNAPSIEWMQRFVIFAKYKNSKMTNILVADYTLSYQKLIVQGGLNIFPKWADKEQKNFFYTKADKKPTLYKVNIYTGKKTKILSSDGMIVASDVSEDEKSILITMAPHDQSDIYKYNLDSKKLTRLTKYSGIDVNGAFIDNDKKIVFVSDRLGSPNIFAKGLSVNAKSEILINHGKNNNSVTAFGNYIVYVSRESARDVARNTFNLYLISTKTDYIRALTSNGVNQFPKFSEDGESILFLKHYKNQSSLGVIRLNYNESYLFPLNKGKIQSIDW